MSQLALFPVHFKALFPSNKVIFSNITRAVLNTKDSVQCHQKSYSSDFKKKFTYFFCNYAYYLLDSLGCLIVYRIFRQVLETPPRIWKQKLFGIAVTLGTGDGDYKHVAGIFLCFHRCIQCSTVGLLYFNWFLFNSTLSLHFFIIPPLRVLK